MHLSNTTLKQMGHFFHTKLKTITQMKWLTSSSELYFQGLISKIPAQEITIIMNSGTLEVCRESVDVPTESLSVTSDERFVSVSASENGVRALTV